MAFCRTLDDVDVAFSVALMWRGLIPFLIFYAYLLFIEEMWAAKGRWFLAVNGFFIKRLDIIALPFVSMVALNYFTPVSGGFIAYYHVRNSDEMRQAFDWTITFLLTNLALPSFVFSGLPFFIVLIFCFMLFYFGRELRFFKPAWRERLRISFILLLGGLVGLFGASLPYIILGKFPVFTTWSLRHALAYPVPIAFIVASVGYALPFRWVSSAFFACVGIFLVSKSWDEASRLQFRWFEDRAIIQALHDNKEIFDSANYLDIDINVNTSSGWLAPYSIHVMNEWYYFADAAGIKAPALIRFPYWGAKWNQKRMQERWGEQKIDEKCYIRISVKPKVSLENTKELVAQDLFVFEKSSREALDREWVQTFGITLLPINCKI